MNHEEVYIEKCNHNPNDIDNSLKMIKKATMVKPRKFYFQCEECKNMFAFLKEINKPFVSTDL